MGRPTNMLDRVPHRLALLLLTTALCLAAPLEARADKFSETLDFSLHTRATTFSAGTIPLRTIGHGPAPLTDPHLSGRARAIAPMLRANFSLHGFRFGVGAGFEGYSGLQLDHAPLPGSTVTDGRVWGLPLDAFVGYAFRSNERVRPYVEARTTGTFIQAQARMTHRNDGDHATARMRATTFAIAARAGVLIQLNDYFFLDAGLGHILHGPGGWTATLGIGIPIPLSNL